MLDELILEGCLFLEILIVSSLFFSFPRFCCCCFWCSCCLWCFYFCFCFSCCFRCIFHVDSFVSFASIQKSWESQNPKHSHQISQPKNHLFFHSVVCMWFSLPWFSMCSQFTSAAIFSPKNLMLLKFWSHPGLRFFLEKQRLRVTLKPQGRFSCRPQTHPKKQSSPGVQKGSDMQLCLQNFNPAIKESCPYIIFTSHLASLQGTSQHFHFGLSCFAGAIGGRQLATQRFHLPAEGMGIWAWECRKMLKTPSVYKQCVSHILFVEDQWRCMDHLEYWAGLETKLIRWFHTISHGRYWGSFQKLGIFHSTCLLH